MALSMRSGVVSGHAMPTASVSRTPVVVVRAAGGGFGASNSKPKTQQVKRRPDILKEMERMQQDSNTASTSSGPMPTSIGGYDLTKGNWFTLANVEDFAGDKKRKLAELKGNKKMVVLHSYKDVIYAMDAYSTAYQYPLLDAKVLDGPAGPMIETPLDGTTYDLKTGKVIKWCPTDGNPIRGVLGTLKKAADPIPLPVYPCVTKPDGTIAVRLSQ